MTPPELDPQQSLIAAARLVAERCPLLVECCYWSGTSVIALEVLHHRDSLDLDFHTRDAHVNVLPLLDEMESALGSRFHLIASREQGISCWIGDDSSEPIACQVFSSFEAASEDDLVPSTTAPGFDRLTLRRYLINKVQCVAERLEARDLYDIEAALRHDPSRVKTVRLALQEQDLLFMLERLQGWSAGSLAADLRRMYPDIDPSLATEARERLMGWIVELAGEDA